MTTGRPSATRATWKGTVSFGLVSVGVALFAATQDNDVGFKQVHVHPDGSTGAVKQKRVCAGCEQEVAYADIQKGYDPGDGQVMVLEAQDLEALKLETTRAIAVQEFVPLSAVDPIMHERTYYLAPQDAVQAKAYALLRDVLGRTAMAGVVKVAMRQREQVALLHVRDDGLGAPVLALTTLRWADEVRVAAVPMLANLPESTEAELAMAGLLVDSLTSLAFDPDAYRDDYRIALQDVLQARMAGRSTPAPKPANGAVVIDMMTALKASVERAREQRSA
jgi:DNA end-binding protein Ku